MPIVVFHPFVDYIGICTSIRCLGRPEARITFCREVPDFQRSVRCTKCHQPEITQAMIDMFYSSDRMETECKIQDA
jgi:hypothetical protein